MSIVDPVYSRNDDFCSFFGTQEGDFSMSLKSISALPEAPPPATAILVPSKSDLRQLEDGTAAKTDENATTYNRITPDAGRKVSS